MHNTLYIYITHALLCHVRARAGRLEHRFVLCSRGHALEWLYVHSRGKRSPWLCVRMSRCDGGRAVFSACMLYILCSVDPNITVSIYIHCWQYYWAHTSCWKLIACPRRIHIHRYISPTSAHSRVFSAYMSYILCSADPKAAVSIHTYCWEQYWAYISCWVHISCSWSICIQIYTTSTCV